VGTGINKNVLLRDFLGRTREFFVLPNAARKEGKLMEKPCLSFGYANIVGSTFCLLAVRVI
jgi:hypothetical protein